MSAAPFDVAPIVKRIRDGVPSLRQVGTAGDFASMTKLSDFPVPSAYVLLARERGEATKSGMSEAGEQTRMSQVMRVSFGVVVAVRNFRELAGAQLTGALADILGAIRALLGGWTPPGNGTRACQLVQGDLQQYDRATALWQDVWRTQHITTYGSAT